MSMCVRYAGDSYRYLLDSVTTDHGRSVSSPMTRYYTASGTPPGTWLGTGLAGLADGVGIAAGSYVTPRQMERLFRHATDPVTDAPLGRSPHIFATASGKDLRRPVAGFDCTFTVPKSVSVIWALADRDTREVLYRCHRDALSDVLGLIERDVARTRIGTNGVAQVEVRGVVAAAFDHWDSRANDPNLHTHLVIANRVQGPDGRWRTLDSRAMHRAAVAMSERYDALLADHVTDRLGLTWEYRERGPQRNPAYELAAVPTELTDAFCRRSAAITEETDRLIAIYAHKHGHQPNAVTVLKLRQQATLATRDAKEAHSLAELTDHWRRQANELLSADPAVWATQVLADARTKVDFHPASRRPSMVDDEAEAVLAALSRTRSTWTPWNVDAETTRALKAVRFDTAADRDHATAAVVAEVSDRAVLLSAPELASTPAILRRSDGSSAFRPHRSELYTSPQLLRAEARLLAGGRDRSAPVVHTVAIEQTSEVGELLDDQRVAVAAVATSGRAVDVLVGPAGSGKTRTLAALQVTWTGEHGPGSVIGLAPSAAAADVLADALGIATENTAKWLVEHDRETDRLHRIDRARAALHAAPNPATAQTLASHLARLTAAVERWRFRTGQLILVDEASLAGTHTLDRLAACAGEVGAKLLMVGDWAQLSSIEAGGAFGLLVRDRGAGAPQLGAVRRFTEAWERDASTRLRVGDLASIDTYAAHGRLTEGDHAAMVEAAYTAWVADEHNGLRSLLLAGDLDTVRTLNERARAQLVADGRVQAEGAALRDELLAGTGDRVVTRRNDRRLSTGRGWVKNGDQWTVTACHQDGALDVRRVAGSPTVTLPSSYVARHVELAYATTAYRAQGATVDTAHAVVTGPGMTREVLYVMVTRARQSNRAYVCSDRAIEPLPGFTDEPTTGRSVLAAVLRNTGASDSAHETIEAEQENAASIQTLAAEYETLAHLAQAPRWAAVLRKSGLTSAQVEAVETSPAYGALTVALRRAEAHGMNIEFAFPRLVIGSTIGATDLAAVLYARIERWAAACVDAADDRRRPHVIVGLIPPSTGVSDPSLACALDERATLIEQRADALLDRTHEAAAPWRRRLGSPPADPEEREAWRAIARTVVAYRDRYDVTDPDRPLGRSAPLSTLQAADRTRANEALERLTKPTERPAPRRHGYELPAASICPTPVGR